MLLKSLVIIGAITGLVLGSIGTSVPWLFPKIFSPDPEIILEMHRVLVPFFLALCITPSTHCLEGTLMPTSTKGKPAKLHKRKHQIGSLYFDMKQKEMEFAERRAKGYLTKAQTGKIWMVKVNP